MATTAANVRVGVTGGAFHAPLLTAVPTDATAALNAALNEVGYIGEDGITQTIEADSTDIKAWQNGDVVRKIQTSHDLTFSFKMIETNAEALKVYYADADASVTAFQITGDQAPHEVWVLEVADGDNSIRIVLKDAQVTDRGEVTYKTDEAIGYEITLTAYPDASGVKAYVYMDDGSVAAAPSITSVLPSGAAVGDVVAIKGVRFTGTTGITVDGANVLEYAVIDDSTIALLVPATVSGAAAVIVTNATGASAAYSYTAAT